MPTNLELAARRATALLDSDKQANRPRAAASSEDEVPAGWDNFTVQEKWQVKPNLRAREVIRQSSTRAKAKAQIQAETKEPEYAIRDAEIRDAVWQLIDQVEGFSHNFLGFKYTSTDDNDEDADGDVLVPATWFEQLAPQTVKIIGCVATGGPAGVHGWHDLFVDEKKREALCCAIVCNVLVEQVFKHVFFGGSSKDVAAMVALQEEHRDKDGMFWSLF